MYHQFAYHRDDFLTHYHRRSNVETVFAMVKAKFRDNLLGKTVEAQTSEVLAKFVAHNICVLIQAFYELGIEATFDGMSAPAQRMALEQTVGQLPSVTGDLPGVRGAEVRLGIGFLELRSIDR